MPKIPLALQKTAIALGLLAATALAWQRLGWMGVALVFSGCVLWALLHFNRMMMVFKRAANRPIGHVDSAVMLNAKLRPGVNLLHILALTRSLGERLLETPAGPDTQPAADTGTPTEIYRWTDGTGSHVTCTVENGRLAQHVLWRPKADDDLDAPANPMATATATALAPPTVR